MAVDWRRVRLALGMRQTDMADVLGLSRESVSRAERGRQTPGRRALIRLNHYLSLPGARTRLRRAGVRHPFANEIAAAVEVWRKVRRRNPAGPARVCRVCFRPVGLHARCRSCGGLLGPGHDNPIAVDGFCGACRGAGVGGGLGGPAAIARRREVGARAG